MAFVSYILIACIVSVVLIDAGKPVTYATVAGLLWPVLLLLNVYYYIKDRR